jgi:hypothetical protein
MNATLELVRSANESELLKVYAVAAIQNAGDQETRRSLARIAENFGTIGTVLCARLCEALYPKVLDAAGLADLIRKAERVPQSSIDLPWYLKSHLQSCLPDEQAVNLLRELLCLAQETPRIKHNGRETQISEQFYWLGKVILEVLLRILKQHRLDDESIQLTARAFWLLGHFQHYADSHIEVSNELNTLLDQHPSVRRAYVWHSIEEWRRREPDAKPSTFLLFGYYEVVKQSEGDLEWLIEDIMEGDSPEMRTTALRLAIDLWHWYGRKRSIRTRIKRAARGERLLRRLFSKEAANGPHARLKRFWYRHGLSDWKHQMRRFHRRLKQFYHEMRDRIWLWQNVEKLRNGSAINALYHLARKAGEDHNQWGARSWQPLAAKRGVRVARAAADGWKVVLGQFVPSLPHEKSDPKRTDYRIIIGLTAINVGLESGDLDLSSIARAEAGNVCRYAVNELSGFADWLPELVRHHPDAVREVLAECIRGEWQVLADREHVNGMLSSLRYYGEGLAALIGDVILEEFQAGDPLNLEVLEDALTVMLNLPESVRPALADLAAQRAPSQDTDDHHFILWMMVWLQLDSGSAMSHLQNALIQAADPDDLMIRLCAALSPRHGRGYPLLQDPDFVNPSCLQELIPLVYRHIRVEDDIDRIGGSAYSPTTRDHAQDFRGGLIDRLAELPGHETDSALRTLMGNPLFSRYHDRILPL